MRKFTIITGHGKLEFIQKADGHLELLSAQGKFLSKAKIGKLGTAKEKKCK
jgi:hypothetical protein